MIYFDPVKLNRRTFDSVNVPHKGKIDKIAFSFFCKWFCGYDY